jgi:linoleoyl-CoA desaturase
MPRRRALGLLWASGASKVVYIGYSLVIPLMVIDQQWWWIIAGFVLVPLIAGAILGVVLQLAHVVEGTQHPIPDTTGDMGHTWVVHEMLTTSNFARKSPLVTWYVGRLNYQVEHPPLPARVQRSLSGTERPRA